MTHSHRYAKSQNEWFRLDVPARLRGLVGKTAWKQSLHTTDKNLAAVKRAELTSFYKAEIIRLDGVLGALETQDACGLVDNALELLAARNGSLDAVVRAILTFMTLRARQSWGRHHEREANWDFGIFLNGGAEDLSNKLMRFLRKIGIEDRENVYHSFRHSLKRELRDDEQTKEEI